MFRWLKIDWSGPLTDNWLSAGVEWIPHPDDGEGYIELFARQMRRPQFPRSLP